MGYNGLYWVAVGSTGLHLVFISVNGLFWVKVGSTGLYRV